MMFELKLITQQHCFDSMAQQHCFELDLMAQRYCFDFQVKH